VNQFKAKWASLRRNKKVKMMLREILKTHASGKDKPASKKARTVNGSDMSSGSSSGSNDDGSGGSSSSSGSSSGIGGDSSSSSSSSSASRKSSGVRSKNHRTTIQQEDDEEEFEYLDYDNCVFDTSDPSMNYDFTGEEGVDKEPENIVEDLDAYFNRECDYLLDCGSSDGSDVVYTDTFSDDEASRFMDLDEYDFPDYDSDALSDIDLDASFITLSENF